MSLETAPCVEYTSASGRVTQNEEGMRKPTSLPSLSVDPLPCTGDYHLTTRNGVDIHLFRCRGIWRAKILDLSREEVPVVCPLGKDIEKELGNALRGPKSLCWSRLNIVCLGGRRFVLLGSLGLIGGGISGSKHRRDTSDMPEVIPIPDDIVSTDSKLELGDRRRGHPSSSNLTSKLKNLLEDGGVCSTDALTDNVNNWPNSVEREALIHQTISAYVDVLKKTSTLSLDQLIEFASLNQMKIISKDAKGVMRDNWLRELFKRATEGETLLDGLLVGLEGMDIMVFNNDPTFLITMTGCLMKMLEPKTTTLYTESSAPRQCKILCAVYFLFHLIWAVNSLRWDMSEVNGQFPEFKRKAAEIIKAAGNCFPVLHHAKLVEQSIIKLGSKEIRPELKYHAKIAYNIVKGGTLLWNAARSGITFRFDLQSVEKAIEHFKEARGNYGREETWFIFIQRLNDNVHDVICNGTHLEEYLKNLDAVQMVESLMELEHRQHLRYGIVEQLTLLLLIVTHREVKDRVLQKLDELTKRQDEVARHPSIQDLKNKRLQQIQRCEGEAKLPSTSHQKRSVHVIAQRPQSVDNVSVPFFETLFDKIKEQMLGTSVKCTRKEHPLISGSKFLEQLKEGYRRKFGFTSSVCQQKEVVDFRFNLMSIYCPPEQLGVYGCGCLVDVQKTEVDLDALYSSNECKSNVLVSGLPGAGKSMLGQRLAVEWSKGNWGERFAPVFLLQVSRLVEEDRGSSDQETTPSLATCIAKTCFPRMIGKSNSKELLHFVNKELANPKTLVILDEVEEATDDQANLVKSIKEDARMNNHQVLELIRPNCTSEDALGRSDTAVFELAGLKNSDMEEILSKVNKACLDQMKACPEIWDLAHNPLHLRLLSELLSPTNASSLQKENPRSLAVLLRSLVEEIWTLNGKNKRCTVEQSDAFDELGKLALVNLEREQCSVNIKLDGNGDPQIVEACIERGLLMRSDRARVEFTHILFMQYFAGRLLAKMLFQGGNEEETAKSCIQKVKYRINDCKVLMVIAAEIGKERNAEGIKTLLTVIDEKKELLGIQHLRVKMSCLQEWLSVCCAEDKTTFSTIDKEFKISETLNGFLKMGMMHVQKNGKRFDDSILKAVISLLKEYPSVAVYAKSLLPSVTKEIDRREWNVDNTVIQALAMIIHIHRQSEISWTTFLKEGLDASSEVRKSVIKSIALIGQVSRKEVNWLMTKLLTVNEDIESSVRVGDIEALGFCIQGNPQCIANVVKSLQRTWRRLGCEERDAVAKVFVSVIRLKPDKAEAIVQSILKEQAEAPWPAAYRMMKTILTVLPEIHEHADAIVEIVKQHCDEKTETHFVALVLEMVINLPAVPIKCLPQLISKTVEAFGNEEWHIRNKAFCAVGVIAQQQPSQLTQELMAAFINGCKTEQVWKARCTAFEAAANVLASNANHQDLRATCLEALGNADDEIRKRAGQAVQRVVALDDAQGARILEDLERRYWKSNNETKHGIVSCLHLVAKDQPNLVKTRLNVLKDAIRIPDYMLCSTAIAVFPLLAASERDVGQLIKPLITTCRREDVYFCGLHALKECVKTDHHYFSQLIEVLKMPLKPKRVDDWMTYLDALSLALTNPQSDALVFLKAVFEKTKDELSGVTAKRREVMERISLSQLVQWYDIEPMTPLLHQICRRLCEVPCVFDERDAHYGCVKMKVYSKKVEFIDVRHQLADKITQLIYKQSKKRKLGNCFWGAKRIIPRRFTTKS